PRAHGLRRFVGETIKAVARAHTQARALHLHVDLREAAPARRSVDLAGFGPIADEIKALLIVERALDAARQVVVVLEEDAAGLLREIVEAVLRLEVARRAVVNRRAYLLPVAPLEIVLRRGRQRGQAARVHRVDDYRGAVGEIDQAAHGFEHALALGVALENGDAVREEDRGLTTGQLAQAFDDEVERAECADRENLFAVGFDVVADLAQGVGLRARLVNAAERGRPAAGAAVRAAQSAHDRSHLVRLRHRV